MSLLTTNLSWPAVVTEACCESEVEIYLATFTKVSTLSTIQTETATAIEMYTSITTETEIPTTKYVTYNIIEPPFPNGTEVIFTAVFTPTTFIQTKT